VESTLGCLSKSVEDTVQIRAVGIEKLILQA